MTADQVGPLVRQDRIQLAGIQRLHRAGGQDHRGLPARDAVCGGWECSTSTAPRAGAGRRPAARSGSRLDAASGPGTHRRRPEACLLNGGVAGPGKSPGNARAPQAPPPKPRRPR